MTEVVFANENFDERIDPIIMDTIQKIYAEVAKNGMDNHLNMDVVHENLSKFKIKMSTDEKSPVVKYDFESNTFLVNASKADDCDFRFHFAKEMMLLLVNDKQKEPGINNDKELMIFDEAFRNNYAEAIFGDDSNTKDIEPMKVVTNILLNSSDLDKVFECYARSDIEGFKNELGLTKTLIKLSNFDYNFAGKEVNGQKVQSAFAKMQDEVIGILQTRGLSDEQISQELVNFVTISDLTKNPDINKDVYNVGLGYGLGTMGSIKKAV